MESSGQIGQVERPPVYVNADIEEVEMLARLEPDWDSYGAATISPQAIALAKDLLVYTAIGAASLGIEAHPYYIGPFRTVACRSSGDETSGKFRLSDDRIRRWVVYWSTGMAFSAKGNIEKTFRWLGCYG